MRNLIVIIAFAIRFSACKKEAGEGGSSVIKGKVYQLTLWDNNGVWDTLEYKLDAEKEVYIIYSNNEKIGKITSSVYSPRLKKNIGLAIIKKRKASAPENYKVNIKGNQLEVKICTLPFLRNKTSVNQTQQ